MANRFSKKYGPVKSKPHPSCMRIFSFEVEAMVLGYNHQYKQSGMHKLANNLNETGNPHYMYLCC